MRLSVMVREQWPARVSSLRTAVEATDVIFTRGNTGILALISLKHTQNRLIPLTY